jgi:hypothetical protein
MMTQSYKASGSTSNDATAAHKLMNMNYLLLGVYFSMSLLRQYFSLKPA